MAKGSSSRSGPAPDPNALRRERDSGDWVTLPAKREGKAPAWPLGNDVAQAKKEIALLEKMADENEAARLLVKARVRLLFAQTRHKRELVLWAGEWKRPQATQWERNHQELEIAIYVRSLADAEQLGASTMKRTLLRQQQEALGISIPGLMRNRWTIVSDMPQVRGTPRAPVGDSVRGHLKVVPGGAEAA